MIVGGVERLEHTVQVFAFATWSSLPLASLFRPRQCSECVRIIFKSLSRASCTSTWSLKPCGIRNRKFRFDVAHTFGAEFQFGLYCTLSSRSFNSVSTARFRGTASLPTATADAWSVQAALKRHEHLIFQDVCQASGQAQAEHDSRRGRSGASAERQA